MSKQLFDIKGTNDYKIQMVIDNDLNKRKILFENKILIEHPNFIKDWSDCFIIITTEKYSDDIQSYLENLGLMYEKDFIYYKDLYSGKGNK